MSLSLTRIDDMNTLLHTYNLNKHDSAEVIDIMEDTGKDMRFSLDIFRMKKELPVYTNKKATLYCEIYNNISFKDYSIVPIISDILNEIGQEDEYQYAEELYRIMKLLDNNNITYANTIYEISNDLGISDYKYIEKFILEGEYSVREIQEKFSCNENEATEYQKIMKHFETTSRITVKRIYSYTQLLNNNDLEYISTVIKYKEENQIEEIQRAEWAYLTEHRSN
ncbi:MAG: hypothetical protein Q8J85_07270 [Sulfuricurvum sp.]|nr:hypothetical protein [Sulfuricurvum sp.]MDP3022973.1 hypothetical protein [Sulfuricurvum sp.]